jgi:hypothetical protein
VMRHLKLACIVVVFLFLTLAACGSETAPAASDPPGALVRLQRNDAATTLPGDFTVFSNGSLQLYLGDRGALRKTVAPADLAGLEAASMTPHWTLWLIPIRPRSPLLPAIR